MGEIRLKRAYDTADPADGRRILVDRLWPRGVSKQRLHLAEWMKDLAPSHDLRRRFGHDPAHWDAFRARYAEELDRRPEAVAALRRRCSEGTVTLVYAARDAQRNNAVALKLYLEAKAG